MIAGEGLAGVAIAVLVAARTRWPQSGWSGFLESMHFAAKDFAWVPGIPGVILGIAVVAAVSALLYRAGRSAVPPTPIAAPGPEGG